ncbi:two-component sensor histidine kinase [Noviherbaspirillum sp. 17J57-3]|uniref:histidine kinase n=2 Tax=Noviherbaspirillum galbum TaxID=2709383 RepID=A0A6B3SNK9_9BURK|nr:two-component sensor histidine kinase [Noviherbaspirillum galbum]
MFNFLAQRLKRHLISVLLLLFAFVLIIGIWTLTLGQIVDTKNEFLKSGAHDAASFARAFQEHTERTIESADQAVEFLSYEYLKQGMKLDIPALLNSGVIHGDIFNLFTITDQSGDVILSSKPFARMNLADREHIRVHREQTVQGLFVSKPVLGRVSGKWSIQLTRRIDNPNGTLGGVVVVSMDPFYFTRLYESIQISPNSSVSLVGLDGIVRARRTNNKSEVGQNLAGTQVFRKLNDSDNGTFIANSAIDGRDRIYAYRKLNRYPLIVMVGVDIEDLMQAYLSMRDHALQQALLSTLAIVAFTLLLLTLIHRLMRSKEQAIAANAAKTQFLSTMSHELRTPLNGIIGYAELLQEDLPDNEHRSFAGYILDSGNHLLGLVNSVLHLNKIEAGKMELNLGSVDVQRLIAQAVNTHRASALVKGLAFEVRCAANLPATLVCDRVKTLQVLNNLLHNAIKFTHSGSVCLEAEYADGQLSFHVIDSGPGIPEDMREKVFEEFFQSDTGDSRASEGTGLGLAIVKKFVDLMGGTVSITASASGGARFTFRLPAILPAETHATDSRHAMAA